jgi:hypothetical protein
MWLVASVMHFLFQSSNAWVISFPGPSLSSCEGALMMGDLASQMST